MDNYQFAYLLTLLVQVIMSIVILGRQGYYLKKGQNTADKEDIKQLTKMVEGVKSEFLRDNAKITADLDILKDKRGKTYSQTQQAIINFYSDFNSLFYFMVNHTPQFQLENHADDILENVQKLKTKADVSYSIMTLLIESETSLDTASKMHRQIFELTMLVQARLIEIRFDTPTKKKILDRLSETNLNKEEKDGLEKMYEEKEKKMNMATESYIGAIQNYKKEINVNQAFFERHAKAYLHS
jgi:hypothetical protein